MSLGTDATGPARAARVGRPATRGRAIVALLGLALAVAYAKEVRRDDSLEAVSPSCATPLAPTQGSSDEVRGCCILVTPDGPRCAYTNRAYCETRAAEAGLQFEFHEVGSCSELPQCR